MRLFSARSCANERDFNAGRSTRSSRFTAIGLILLIEGNYWIRQTFVMTLYNRSYVNHTRVHSPSPDDVQLENMRRLSCSMGFKLDVAFHCNMRYHEDGDLPQTTQTMSRY